MPFALSKIIENDSNQKLIVLKNKAVFISGETEAVVAPREKP